jgi:hypothetical protein
LKEVLSSANRVFIGWHSIIGNIPLGTTDYDFVYHHMNKDMHIKTGKCHSVPTVLENGKIELSEQWEWTSRDYSKGESLMVDE